MAYFAVTTAPGPQWDRGRDRREQPGWRGHADFMDALVDEGFVVLGGPVDDTHALLLVAADTEEQIVRRFAGDPWLVSGVLTLGGVQQWLLWLGSPPG